MLKRVQRQPWTCARCLLKQQRRLSRQQRRCLVGVATAAKEDAYPPPATHIAPSASQDDSTLRRIFDSHTFWKEFSTRLTKTGKRAGLLQNRHLTSPHGFQQFAQDALKKCQRIVKKICAASTVEDYKSTVRDFDCLSDQLCRVIDLSDFIASVHPSTTVQEAASQAHGQMYQYMNVLNTTPELELQLKKANAMPEVTSSWSAEEQATAKILLKDFEQSAISSPADVRKRFVDLSNTVMQAGQELIDTMSPAEHSLKFSSSDLVGMDPLTVKPLTRFGTSTLQTHAPHTRLALRSVRNPDVRQRIYAASRTASKESISNVERLVTSRSELASLAGHQSFAHMTLTDKMAQTPEAVASFLDMLSLRNKPHTESDLSQLTSAKRSDVNDPSAILHAWDRDYYTSLLRRNSRANTLSTSSSENLAPYFSLGTVMQGLSRLFDRLYGVRLVPRETLSGETWNSDVRRLDVIDEDEGHIAVIYCDLFQRPGKSPNPAHYTLRCSREITSTEAEDVLASSSSPLPNSTDLESMSHLLNDGMSLTASATKPGTYNQLPTIAFICDFPASTNSAQPTLLTQHNLSTLFHEMGHCLHSILGRTSLQNVSGTRCATDFAELPSVLMEHFAASPAVLSLFARHWQTNEPLDVSLVSRQLEDAKTLRTAWETESQIALSLLDQRLHSLPPGPVDSTAIYRRLFSDADTRAVTLPDPSTTSWHAFFGHLFQYGGVYYSYLFDRAIAGKVWEEVFSPSPSSSSRWGGGGGGGGGGNGGGEAARALSRSQGALYREQVLSHGGSRDGWACVAGVLGPERAWMSEGGTGAMEEVGRWGAVEVGG
ncbi:MAG: Mitochondrial intermediate peptidase [Chrysothrix sp. TS-e1954]|nr:MAG: Mitochondrial intermediate peptidase [Chrysothrix sp. TS-e1954]